MITRQEQAFNDFVRIGMARRLTHEYARAAEYFLLAAVVAPARSLEHVLLNAAWCAMERASGRVSQLEQEVGS